MVQILPFAFWGAEKREKICQNCRFQRKTGFGTLLAISEAKANVQTPILIKSEEYML